MQYLKMTRTGSNSATCMFLKPCRTKSGKTTKKKKKVSSQPDISSGGELKQEESLDREDSPQLQDNPDPPAAEEERETEQLETQQPEPPHFEQPAMASLKQLSPDVTQRNTASLRRRPRGPAPPPPPPGSKTMTLGRIRPGEQRDITTKSRGFTVSATTESVRPASDEITTKSRSVSDALPPSSEKVEIVSASSLTPVGTRHRPTRKAPSRPAPVTPPRREKVKVDEGKTAESRPKSLTGSPRRPPPNIPTAAAQQQGGLPPSSDDDRDTNNVKSESNALGEVEESSNRLPHEAAVGKEVEKEDEDDESLQQTAISATSSKPPLTPPKPRGHQQQGSPGQSPSGGRRKEAATVICKDTKDGGKELIVKPSPHSKRKFAGPLIFKMPPPPSAPPSKAKAKKPPPPTSAKPVKKDGTGSSIAETYDIYTESADSSVSESISDVPGEIASSLKASSPPKSLSDTLVSNEFTNLDELLSDSQQDNIATTDFSIEENLEPVDENNALEWNESHLQDPDSIPYQDPDLEMVAALNFNSNNNNNQETDDGDYNYGDFPPPPEIPPPLSTKSGEDSDEWEQDSNRTGELNFDSDSSIAELSKHSIEDGIVALEEEVGPGGVVLLNIKQTENDDIPVYPEELEQGTQTGKTDQMTSENLIPPPASIPRDPSIGAQLSELDDVVSSLAELAAEVPSVPSPPTSPPPPPSLFTSSQPHPITSSTPTQQGEAEEHRPSSPEPPPIPLTLPPSLSDNDDIDDDDFPLGPPPPLVTSEPPSLTPSPPGSPLNDSRTHEMPSPSQRRDNEKDKQQQSEEDRDYELLNKLKQRQIKGSSSWRRRRGSKDQEAAVVDDGESELLERLKQRQTLYKQKAKTCLEEPEVEPTEHVSGQNPNPTQPSGMGMGTGGDTVQLQLQFLQQQVLQQQMMQLQQQFQQLHSYALQQGVSMPTNMMQVPGVSGAMLNQQAAFMATPMAPPTGPASQPQQQIMMQTSAGPVLVPATQMMHGQGITPNPQAMQQLSGQGFAPNAQLQQIVYGHQPPTQTPGQTMMYGQGVSQAPPLPQTQPPVMSTSITTSQPMVYGQGVSQAPPLPQTQPPVMSTSITSNQPMVYGQGVSQDPPPPPLPQTQPPVLLTSDTADKSTLNPSEVLSSEQESSSSERAPTTGTGTKVTPARMSYKRRSEDVRALVLGPLEEQFDSLMDQVRDADPTAVLKKVRFSDISCTRKYIVAL